MSDDTDGKWMTKRRSFLLGAAGAVTGAASTLGSGDTNEDLAAATMNLNEAYNVAGNLWVGPDSAKGNVSADSGRIYMAADSQVDYYGDAGSWVKMGVGSSSQPVPSIHTDKASVAEQPTGKDGSYVGQRGGLSTTVSPSVTHYPHLSNPTLRAGYQTGSTVYAFKQDSSGDIHKSTDKGASYTQQGTIGKSVDYVHHVEASGTLLAWASDGTVHRSTDDGATWTSVLTANYTPLSQQGITETPSGYILFGEYTSGTTATFHIYRSTDDGSTWGKVYTTDSTRGDAANPGHVHNVQYDSTEGAAVALLDYPDIRVVKSTDEGATWSVVADETKAEHPNFVSLMFFDEGVAWGYDSHGMNGWVRWMKRADFYSGDWALGNINDVAKFNDKMSYASYPVGDDAWLITQANESNEDPGMYGQEMHVIYHDGHDFRVSDGLSFADVANTDNLSTNGNIPWLCGYPFDRWSTASGDEQYRGTTVVNIKTNLPLEFAAVPVSVGEQASTTQISGGSIGDWVLPQAANIRGRAADGNLYTMLTYGNNATVLKNSQATNNPLLKVRDNDRLQFETANGVQFAVKPGFEAQFNVPLDVSSGGPNGTGELGFSNSRIYEDSTGEVVVEDSAGNTTIIS